MKKLFIIFSVLLAGCAALVTGVTSDKYSKAPLVLFYSNPEIIREQNEVATLIFLDKYSATINSVMVRDLVGRFNPNLRISKSDDKSAYVVDLMPGTYTLEVAYDSYYGATSGTSTSMDVGNSGKAGASYSGSSVYSWIRTSKTTHTLKGGEIYIIGLAMLTASGEIDLYSLDNDNRDIIIELREKAQF